MRTRRLIRETSSTSDEPQQKRDESETASTESEAGGVARPGVLLAGLVLLAALSTAGTAPAGVYTRRRNETVAESSTADIELDPELFRQIEQIFKRGESEFFQDGMYSDFSRSLIAMLRQYGRAAFQAIGEFVFSGSGNPDVISEALRWLADFDDPATLAQRWAILERTLRDRSPRVRDGAVLGFGALDDPRARHLLVEAQKSEPIPEIRRLIQQVVQQLNATHADPAAQR